MFSAPHKRITEIATLRNAANTCGMLTVRTCERSSFRKLLKGLQYVPSVMITDKLKSYSAAKAEVMPGVEHRQHKGKL